LFAIVHIGSGIATIAGALVLSVQYRRDAGKPCMNAPDRSSERQLLWRFHRDAAIKTQLRMLWQDPGARFDRDANLLV
jgi:hypothetical protein